MRFSPAFVLVAWLLCPRLVAGDPIRLTVGSVVSGVVSTPTTQNFRQTDRLDGAPVDRSLAVSAHVGSSSATASIHTLASDLTLRVRGALSISASAAASEQSASVAVSSAAWSNETRAHYAWDASFADAERFQFELFQRIAGSGGHFPEFLPLLSLDRSGTGRVNVERVLGPGDYFFTIRDLISFGFPSSGTNTPEQRSSFAFAFDIAPLHPTPEPGTLILVASLTMALFVRFTS